MKTTAHNNTVNTNDNLKEENTMKNPVTFEAIAKINSTLSTIDVKGKKYTPVVERIKAFRMLYPQGSISTELLSCQDGMCVMKAMVATEDGLVLGTGTAFERMDSSFINKTSFIENCETSAVGRALGMAGIGIDASLCSADELLNAVKQQREEEQIASEAKSGKPTRVDQVKQLCASIGITVTQFGEYRNAAVMAGMIPDRKVNDLTDKDFELLLHFVEKNAALPA